MVRSLEKFIFPAVRLLAPGILAFGILALGLAACETPPPLQKLPELTFAHLGPLKLNVAKIDIVSKYRSPLKAPNVEHLFPTPPQKALRTWARDRLRAVGRSGTARLVIHKASAVETALEMKTGLKAAFTKQQSRRYDVIVDATLEISTPEGRGSATAQASRFSTLREDATINDRNKMWFDLTENLMRDFNAEMEKKLAPFLAR